MRSGDQDTTLAGSSLETEHAHSTQALSLVLGQMRLHDEPQNKEINRLVGILGDSCGNRVRSLVDVYKISLTLLVLVS